MNWRTRLADRRGGDISKEAGSPTDKTDETAFVSSVSDPDDHYENIAPDSAPFDDALKTLRTYLLALADAEGINPAHVHRLHDLDVALCIGLDTRQLAAYLSMLADSAEREAGRAPAGDTAAMHCERCGPVWIHPRIAKALPAVGGWPRALGCPWCFVRDAGGFIPRPLVKCGRCKHFIAGVVNTGVGLGCCARGHSTQCPATLHRCSEFSPLQISGD